MSTARPSGPRPLDRRFWPLLAAGAAGLALFLLAALGLLYSTLDEAGHAAAAELLAGRWPLLVLVWLAACGAWAWVLKRLFAQAVAPVGRLLEQGRALIATRGAQPLATDTAPAPREATELASLVNSFVAQREALRADMDARVREASQNIEQEKTRLAALMSELTQSVVVCNLDGRILLYNNRARMQFRALSQAPRLADGAELVGLGRSIYAVFDRQLVAHALDSVQKRMQRGAASPTAQFVTSTQGGQLLRVQMAPVRQVGEPVASPATTAAALSGFVLMLENITREFEQETAREQLLLGLTEGSRSALANIQAAVEMLELPDVAPEMRSRFLGVVREEVRGMGQRIQTLLHESADSLKTRWPMEDMLGSDLLQAAARRIEEMGGVPVHDTEADPALWLRVESFSLLQALAYLSARLKDEFGVRFVKLRLKAAGSKAELDLIWAGQAMSTETVMSWELDAMRTGTEASTLSVRDVVERHGGAFWFERDRASHSAFFRFLLPSASPQEQADATTYVRNESRPEYYDFDLFRTSEQTRALDDRLLTELTYTVFDTETTGLNPSQGDEIIQIGAARIVNGKLLRQESFEQLVDPGRTIPAASIPIHGITPDMVQGQPRIAEVLPAFHAFALDTVLVAHNAAFDMRFLQLKERQTGVSFDHPVLDTLLLSALVQPQQESHRLEAIAERFNIVVIGRHTAMGDAMVTAEVFLKLVPLLAERGIHTLGQAREAAQKTYYARLKY